MNIESKCNEPVLITDAFIISKFPIVALMVPEFIIFV